MRVFVSYTSKDPKVTKKALEQVEQRITPFAKVFIDILHNKRRRQCRVNYELCRSDIVLQIVSPKYKSEWVQKELLFARKKGKSIIKVGIDEILAMDDEEIYVLLSDMNKKGWSVWALLFISLILCIGVSLIGIWLSYLYVSSQTKPGVEGDLLNYRGLFGDSWGGVNAIVSALAFAGVIVTLFLQNRDLNLQRKEMARQREEFKKENTTLKYQRFENLFYNMLNLQQEIVAGLKFDYEDEEYTFSPDSYIQERRSINRTVTGRDVFRYTFDKAIIFLQGTETVNQNNYIRGYRRYLGKEGLVAYDNTWIPTYYDHYFRHLYKIIQFVDSQGFPFNESYKYVSLLRGTLSRYELVWIYYNALSPSFVKFKKLIEKYSLLKNIREDLLTLCLETEKYYEGLGITQQNVREKGFSGLDFEFYLTDKNDEQDKYHISAFWSKNEIKLGQDCLNRWRAYIDDLAGGVIVSED